MSILGRLARSSARPADRGQVPEIAAHHIDPFVAGRRRDRLPFRLAAGLVTREKHDGQTGGGQPFGDRTSDPRRRASHERRPSVLVNSRVRRHRPILPFRRSSHGTRPTATPHRGPSQPGSGSHARRWMTRATAYPALASMILPEVKSDNGRGRAPVGQNAAASTSGKRGAGTAWPGVQSTRKTACRNGPVSWPASCRSPESCRSVASMRIRSAAESWPGAI